MSRRCGISITTIITSKGVTEVMFMFMSLWGVRISEGKLYGKKVPCVFSSHCTKGVIFDGGRAPRVSISKPERAK
jgi:hypothetical protein